MFLVYNFLFVFNSIVLILKMQTIYLIYLKARNTNPFFIEQILFLFDIVILILNKFYKYRRNLLYIGHS
jgi:hypothetical protein